MSPVIEFINVSFAYEKELILDGVNFSLESGTPAAIIGPNGGGKSTLLKLILGIEKPISGTVKVFGLPPGKSKEKIGYMPQYLQFDQQFPICVHEVVLMGLVNQSLWGRFSKVDKQLALDALEVVGMLKFKKTAFSDLSGGERQRVMIARSIVSQPKLLILDEPTNNVDPAVEEKLLALLSELRQRMDIITVSHDLDFVSDVIETVLCVNKVVHIHPVKSLNKDTVNELYSHHQKVVVHSTCEANHTCSEKVGD
ncbi:MAG: ABC transporter ATP-binding protein [Lentisphaeria bacterium]|nr:ABC transporter ATP-binding protein [Lentisphaeria bacterium]